jgi:superfamily II DNA or RNA helicase
MQAEKQVIRLGKLAASVQAAELSRGRAYFRNGRVSQLEKSSTRAGSCLFKARVRAAKDYLVRLELSQQEDLLLDWRCSCPLEQESPCRHILAVLVGQLQLEENSQQPRVAVSTEVQLLFRYQKHDGTILVLPRVSRLDAAGKKLLSCNPLDPLDLTISSQMENRTGLRQERSIINGTRQFLLDQAGGRSSQTGYLAFDLAELPYLADTFIPALPDSWRVLYDREFSKIIPAVKPVQLDFTNLRRAGNGLLSFNLQLYCDKLAVSLEQLLAYLAGQQRWLLLEGSFIEAANKEELLALLGQLTQLQESAEAADHFELAAADLASLVQAEEARNHYFDKSFAGLDLKDQPDRQLPENLSGILRPYQESGLNWLLYLQQNQLGGVLADDMGLGKTLQVLASLAVGQNRRPALIVCPKTLLFNWLHEARRFVPQLKTVIVHGAPGYRQKILAQAADFDILLTSYPLLLRDINSYSKLEFSTCILDEAQMIKNHRTHLARHTKSIKADCRLALSGTPLENTINDLWSIFDFVLPGFLGKLDQFTHEYETDPVRLNRKVRPFLLRRTKLDVLPQLPKKQEITLFAALTQNQLAYYQQTLTRVRQSLVQADAGSQNRLAVLAGLTRLRQICNHPGLVHEPYRKVKGVSGKLALFEELLANLLASGHKVLVFSQFTAMLAILRRLLTDKKIPFSYLDGQTKERQTEVDRFNKDPQKQVFLISLKAGGFGLNLTAADTVIIFDPWWNPLAENQAADRVHRIGQKKAVTVYRLITQDTIEEKMQELQKSKLEVFTAVLERQPGQASRKFSLAELRELLEISHST